jgi:ubiquinone/menaquinone biosynthesis C-methylase UbiE
MSSQEENTNVVLEDTAAHQEPPPATTCDWNAKRYADSVRRITFLHATDLICVLKKDILKAKTILDVGCGTGAFGLAYLQQFPKGIPGQTLILSDLSPSMIDKAKAVMRNYIPEGFETEVKFQIEDGTTLEGIGDSSIDMVVSTFGVFLIPDRASALKAIKRVLKPSGIFGNVAWSSIGSSQDDLKKEGFGVGFQDAVHTALAEVMDGQSAPWRDWFDPQLTHTMLVDEAGFTSTKVFRSIHSVVWFFADLWQVVDQWKFKDINPEYGIRARQKVRDYVLGDKEDEGSPFLLWTASNLAISRNPASTK